MDELKITVANTPAAEQCGRFPEAGIHQTINRYRKRKETTSKTRTAAAGGALWAIIKTDTMRISILLIIVASMFSCRGNSNENQTRVYATQNGEFIISIDTLNINLKPYVSPDKVSLCKR